MIDRFISPAVLAAAFVALLTSSAHATVTFQFINRGTPTDGTLTMTGWRGYTIRLISDSGPISRVDLQAFGIGGAIAQRWIDTTDQGKFYPPFVQTSPGFSVADNTTPSVDDFDSHLLGDPTHFIVTTAPSEAMVHPHNLYLRTGLPSTNTVGYIASFPGPVYDAFDLTQGGKILGSYDVLPTFQTTSLDVAYVVTDSSVLVNGIDATADGQVYGLVGQLTVPEPASAGVAAAVTVASLLRRRRQRRRLGSQPCRVRSYSTGPSSQRGKVRSGTNGPYVFASYSPSYPSNASSLKGSRGLPSQTHCQSARKRPSFAQR